MSVLTRGCASFAAVLVWGWINFFLETAGPLVSGPMAGKQFENSDGAFVASQYGMRLFSWAGGLSTLILLATLAAIWWGRLRQRAERRTLPRIGLLPGVALLLLGSAPGAFAYFDTTDKTEGPRG